MFVKTKMTSSSMPPTLVVSSSILWNSLPQSEYEGAILEIKDKLRKGDVELPEIEQILEDKYQAMKHVKG